MQSIWNPKPEPYTSRPLTDQTASNTDTMIARSKLPSGLQDDATKALLPQKEEELMWRNVRTTDEAWLLIVW